MNTSNITVNTQSSIRITGSRNLYFDPFQISNEAHDADLIFITHSHRDHLDPESISRVSNRNTIFVAPVSMDQELRKVVGDAELMLMPVGGSMLLTAIWHILTDLKPYTAEGYLAPKPVKKDEILTTSQALNLLKLRGYVIKDDDLPVTAS